MDKPFVVACVPAFNEEDRIASVIVRAGMTVEAICLSMSTGLPWAVCLTGAFQRSSWLWLRNELNPRRDPFSTRRVSAREETLQTFSARLNKRARVAVEDGKFKKNMKMINHAWDS